MKRGRGNRRVALRARPLTGGGCGIVFRPHAHHVCPEDRARAALARSVARQFLTAAMDARTRAVAAAATAAIGAGNEDRPIGEL